VALHTHPVPPSSRRRGRGWEGVFVAVGAVRLCVCLSVCLSVCLPIYLSIYPSICWLAIEVRSSSTSYVILNSRSGSSSPLSLITDSQQPTKSHKKNASSPPAHLYQVSLLVPPPEVDQPWLGVTWSSTGQDPTRSNKNRMAKKRAHPHPPDVFRTTFINEA
jgi:hypothetical protein